MYEFIRLGPDTAEPITPPGTPRWLVRLILAAVVFAAFSATLGHDFTFDDALIVKENPWLSRWGAVRALVSPAYFYVFQESSYRPLVSATYLLDTWLWGTERAAGFHLTNLFLHWLAVCSLASLATFIFKDWTAGLFTGLAGALHPAVTEAVNAIGFREDILAALFLILALHAYLRARFEGISWQSAQHRMALFWWALALLSKETALAGVLIAGLIEWKMVLPDMVPKRGRPLVPWVVVGVGYGILRLLFNSRQEFWQATWEGGAGFWLGRIIEATGLHFRKLLLPWPLAADYVPGPYTISNAGFLWSIGAIIIFVATLLFLRHSDRTAAFFLATLACLIIPTSNLIPLENFFSERSLYAPAMIFALLMGHIYPGAWATIPGREAGKVLRAVIIGCGAGLLGVSAFLVHLRNPVWADDRALWTATANAVENSSRAQANYGAILERQGQRGEALQRYREALKLDPRNATAAMNLGSLLYHEGKQEEALSLFRQAKAGHPFNPQALYNEGMVLLHRGDTEAVEQMVSEYLHNRGETPELRWLAGAAARKLHKDGEAENHWLRAAELKPGWGLIWINLGNMYREQEKWDQALEAFQKAAEVQPRDAAAWNNICGLWLHGGQAVDFEDACKKALTLDEKLLEAYANLGNYYRYGQNQPQEAAFYYQQGLQRASGNPMEPFFQQELQELQKPNSPNVSDMQHN